MLLRFLLITKELRNHVTRLSLYSLVVAGIPFFLPPFVFLQAQEITFKGPLPLVFLEQEAVGKWALSLDTYFDIVPDSVIHYQAKRLSAGVYPILENGNLWLSTAPHFTGKALLGIRAMTGNDTLDTQLSVYVQADLPTCAQHLVRIFVLNLDPLMAQYADKPLHEALNWADPKILAEEYLKNLYEASGGFIRFEVVEWVNADLFPPKADGFQYNDTTYLACWTNPANCHFPDGVDYVKQIEDFGIDSLIDAHLIDEIWVFGAPYFGYYESAMAGPGAFWINGAVNGPVNAERPFVMMGFSYERQVAEMLHDLCHRSEATLGDRFFAPWNLANPISNWDHFTANSTQSNSTPGVGTCHFPPNGSTDYDYDNPIQVESTAEDWLNYPGLTGATILVNAETWGGPDYHFRYMNWWFSHLPKAPGINPDSRQNNWWKYIFDFSNYAPNGSSLNTPPEVTDTLPDLHLPQGFGVLGIDLTHFFSNNEITPLQYTALSAPPGLLHLLLRGDSLLLFSTPEWDQEIEVHLSVCDREYALNDSFTVSPESGSSSGETTLAEDLILICPNPFRSSFTLKGIPSGMVAQVRVLSVQGQLLLEEKYDPAKPLAGLTSLPSGMYFVQVSTLQSRRVIKVLKQ